MIKLALPTAPAPRTRDEAKAIAAAPTIAPAAAEMEGRLWGIVIELPNGRQLLTHGGAKSVEEARDRLAYWLLKNPEAKYDLSTVRRMAAAEVAEITHDILKKYPRRRSMKELGDGEWTKCFTEPWRVPGSRIKSPQKARAIIVAGWGEMGAW